MSGTNTPPETPPTEQPTEFEPAPQGKSGLETYNTVTDKIGGPSVRLSDNLISLVGCIAGLILGGLLGPMFMDLGSIWIELAVGGVGGVLAGLFISGFALMVIGLLRR